MTSWCASRPATLALARIAAAGRAHDAARARRARAADIDVFAVATGPGSFTGLRVGIATMQGLAFAKRKPLIGVSALDALAHLALAALGEEARPVRHCAVATWIDAWRGEVFAALYEDGREVEPPTVARPAELLIADCAAAARHSSSAMAQPCYQRCDSGPRWVERARFTEPTAPLAGRRHGRPGRRRNRTGHRPPPHAIRPLYVRRPDAELARRSPDTSVSSRVCHATGSNRSTATRTSTASSRSRPSRSPTRGRARCTHGSCRTVVCHISSSGTDDCAVAGFCAFWLVLRRDPHQQRRACGRRSGRRASAPRCCSTCLAEGATLGARRATLEVRASNEPARRLYERLGFYVAGTRRELLHQSRRRCPDPVAG